MSRHERAGYYVKTKDGKTGFTIHKDGLINGKQPVYLGDGSKILCDPKNLKVIGFKD